jgi:hypothetical protein
MVYGESFISNPVILTILTCEHNMKARNHDPSEIHMSQEGLERLIKSMPDMRVAQYWGLPDSFLGMKICRNPRLGNSFIMKAYAYDNSDILLEMSGGILPDESTRTE